MAFFSDPPSSALCFTLSVPVCSKNTEVQFDTKMSRMRLNTLCAEGRHRLRRLKLAYAEHVARKNGGKSALHCRGCSVNARDAMGSSIRPLWVFTQVPKCFPAVCAKT